MKIVRSAVINLSNANTGKTDALDSIMNEAKQVINAFIPEIWSREMFDKKYIDFKVSDTWLSARMQKNLGMQALQIVKSQRKRKKKTVPVFRGNTINLDSLTVTLNATQTPEFDFWVKFSSIGNKMRLFVPGKRNRQFNRYMSKGWKLLNGCKLRKENGKFYLVVAFEKDVEMCKSGSSVGVDVGYRKVAVSSNGEYLGTKLPTKIDKIVRKKQRSEAFNRSLEERNNYINSELNKLNLVNVKELVIENLKHIRKNNKFGRKAMNRMQRWVYSRIISKLESLAEISGVHVRKVNPAYTSQTCNGCGCSDKHSRCGEVFKCTSCGYEADADYNASLNILARYLGTGVCSPGHKCPNTG
jgi:putative transposase